MNEIAVIGAGKISYSLVNALTKNNFPVTFTLSRTLIHAKQLAVKYNIKNFSSSLEDIPGSVKIFFLAVPDGEIRNVANEISRLHLKFYENIFIHLSGSKNISVLNKLKQKGASTASIHIMQTFPSRKAVNIKDAFAAIESGDIKTEKFLFRLAKQIGLQTFKISSDAKILYHVAGVFAANFLSANLNNSQKALDIVGLKIPAEDLLSPIIISTLKNSIKYGIPGALSGPVERGDYETIEDHINVLKKIKDHGAMLKSYITQSLLLLELAEEKHKALLVENK